MITSIGILCPVCGVVEIPCEVFGMPNGLYDARILDDLRVCGCTLSATERDQVEDGAATIVARRIEIFDPPR